MGNCFTSCLPRCGKSEAWCSLNNMLSGSKGDFSYLIEKRTSTGESEKRSFLSKIFERHKDRGKKQSIGMVEGLLNPQLSYQRLPESTQVSSQSSYISRDMQLQCLDARALLGRTNTSTPDNSLDLEWEHETLPSGSPWTSSVFPEDTVTTQPNPSHLHSRINSTDSDYSRVSSSANSLEWDSVQNLFHSESDVIDTDTQFLLNEIDRLTTQALKETGTIMEDVSYLDDSL